MIDGTPDLVNAERKRVLTRDPLDFYSGPTMNEARQRVQSDRNGSFSFYWYWFSGGFSAAR